MKERLTGAVVLILLAVILLPLLLDDSRDAETRISATNIPEKPDDEFATSLLPVPEAGNIIPVEEKAEDSPESVAAEDTGDTVTGPARESASATVVARADTGTAEINGWVVQVGSFARKNADSLNEKLRAAGYPSYVVDEPVKAKDGTLLYRVRIGPEVQRSKALELKGELKSKQGLDGLVLKYP